MYSRHVDIMFNTNMYLTNFTRCKYMCTSDVFVQRFYSNQVLPTWVAAAGDCLKTAVLPSWLSFSQALLGEPCNSSGEFDSSS